MLTKEYSPSKTIMLEPMTMPQTDESTAKPADAQIDSRISRWSRLEALVAFWALTRGF